MLNPKQRLLIVAALVALSVLAGFFYAATGTAAGGLSRADREAIDGYNDLIESCNAGNGGCRAAEAQRAKFNSEGLCGRLTRSKTRFPTEDFTAACPGEVSRYPTNRL